MSIEAGRNGWRIGVRIGDNPYKAEPGHSLWIKGWKEKQREYDNLQKRLDRAPRHDV